MAKAKIVIRVGPTYEGDTIVFNLCQQQIGITAVTVDTGNFVFEASTLGSVSAQRFEAAVNEFLTYLGCSSDYNVTRSGIDVTIEADNEGTQYNFGNVEIYKDGTVLAGASTNPFLLVSQINGTDPPQCCVSINNVSVTGDSGSNNGTITITGLQTNCSGGAASGFESALFQQATTISAYTSGKTFWNNLPSGNYRIRVRLITNPTCYDDYYINVPDNSVSCDLQITNIVTTPDNGTDNGTATITAITSASPANLEYSLSDGDVFSRPFQSSNLFEDLPPGSYIVEVRDDLGCTVQEIFSITFVAPVPGVKFDPTLIIAEGIPYRFVLDKVSSEFIHDNVLYCEQDNRGMFRKTYTHILGCNDRLTLHFRYVDNIYQTEPRVRIKDYKTDVQIGSTLQMSRIGEYYYLITELSTIANICEKVVYLEIISYRDSTEYFIHGKSEPIKIIDIEKHIQPTLYIRYENGVDYAGIKYAGSVYYNEIRLEAQLRMVSPKIENEKHRLSNGKEILLKSNTQYLWQLETNYLPYFMHKKLALALNHKTVSASGIDYVVEEPYNFDLVDRFEQSKGSAILIEKQNFQQNLI